MAVVISNLRQELVNGNFDLAADITVNGDRKTAVISRFGNAKNLYEAKPLFEPFAVMMLAPAMLAGQPLVIEGEIDEVLLFNLRGIVQEVMGAVVPKATRVPVESDVRANAPSAGRGENGPEAPDQAGGSGQTLPVATAFSGGVDSSHVISRCFLKRDVPARMTIGMLMHHHVGAFSNQSHYQQSLNHVQRWADDHGLPLVGARCDMTHWYRGMTFIQTHPMRNVAAAMSLGHLFSEFLYAAAISMRNMLRSKTFSGMDSLCRILFPVLQSRHNSFRLFGDEYDRTEKSMYVLADDAINDSLNVCCRAQKANDHFLNCGTCIKCCRLIMLAEVMGKVERLEKTFDVEAFRKQRGRCTANVLYRTFGPKGAASNRRLVRHLVDNEYPFPAALRAVLKVAA
jgi:hypothetical protein